MSRFSHSIMLRGVVPALLAAGPCRAETSGLPQLDTLMFPEQLFWLAICFALLYLLMSKVAMPKIAQTQDKRSYVIASELETARSASETVKTTVAQVEKSLAEARSGAMAEMTAMVAKVKEEAAESQAMQQRELSRILHRAEADIAVTREAAMKAVAAGASELGAAIVDKILGPKARVG